MSEVLNTSAPEAVAEADYADFEMPSLQCNEEGWGPSELAVSFRDMPYQPFSKSDRMGKISDWTGNAFNDKKFTNNFLSEFCVCIIIIENVGRIYFCEPAYFEVMLWVCVCICERRYYNYK